MERVFDKEANRIIPGFSRYKIFGDGRILDLETGKFLNLLRAKNYWHVWLEGDDGKRRLVRVHRVLVDAFVGVPKGWVVWPWNGDYFDLRWENLCLGTQSEYRRWTIERPDGVSFEEHLAAVLRRLHFRVEADDIEVVGGGTVDRYYVPIDMLDIVKMVERKLRDRHLDVGFSVKWDVMRQELVVEVER